MLGVVSSGCSSETDGSFDVGVVGVRRGGTYIRDFSDGMGKGGGRGFGISSIALWSVGCGGRLVDERSSISGC